MNPISRIDINNPGDFAPMLTGALDGCPKGEVILLGYKEKDKPSGVLAAVEVEDAIMLRWLVVEEEFQRQGIASKLISVLNQYAEAKNLREIDCVVCLPKKEQEIVKKLLLKNNFQMTEQDKMFSFPISAISEGVFGTHIEKAFRSNVKALSGISNIQIQEFNLRIMEEEGFIPIVPSKLLTDYSFVWLEEGRVTGCILLAPCDEGIEIQWLYGEKPLAVQEMILAAAKVMVQSVPAETRIYATVMQPSVENMIRKLGSNELKEEQTVNLYQCLF